jgi:lysophospholipase L1-like esterase
VIFMPKPILTLLITFLMCGTVAAEGFVDFDRRAQAGERLSVVFFGASLTWGANASNQSETSYRAVIRDRLEEHYPQAHFHCYDAAIGGTGSQLGAFRLDRDVFAHDPDLVFVDFTANDDINGDDVEKMASYESILRRLASAGIPVVQVAFPFAWDIDSAKIPTMKRLAAHHRMATAYGNGWGDAVTRVASAVDAKEVIIKDLWITDPVHPHDPGYRVFAAAAWDGYLKAVKDGLAPQVPDALYEPIYENLQRFMLASIPHLPAGWQPTRPHLTAVNYDWQMSRWLDDMVCARNREPGEKGAQRPVEPLRLQIDAATIILFGEATADSGTFRVRIDGTPVTGLSVQAKGSDLIDGNRWKNGNGHLVIDLAQGLDTAKPHLVEIEPVFSNDKLQELCLESVCVAGGQATVTLAP